MRSRRSRPSRPSRRSRPSRPSPSSRGTSAKYDVSPAPEDEER
jgi:hypothetical protein